MQRGIVCLYVMLATSLPLWGAEPSRRLFEDTLRPPILKPQRTVARSISLSRDRRGLNRPVRAPWGIRLVSEEAVGIARLNDEDEIVPLLENDVSDSETPIPDAEDSIIPPKPLSDVPVSIDGAAAEAERAPKTEETKPATSNFSLGGLIGDQDKLGILELQSRALRTQLGDGETSEFDLNFGYAIRWLNGPSTTDLPPQLYTLLIDVAWVVRISDRLTLDTMITPLWNTDFENKRSDAFRLPWHVVSTYQTDADWSWVIGVTDLDRRDIRFLPVVGATYAPPNGTVQFDLIFPRPRMAWRLDRDEERQHWFYVAGELGGGTWAINRANRTRDMVTLRDLRLLVGLEVRTKQRHAGRLEAGWVFDRVVDYESNAGDYRPADTAMIRWSSDF